MNFTSGIFSSKTLGSRVYIIVYIMGLAAFRDRYFRKVVDFGGKKTLPVATRSITIYFC